MVVVIAATCGFFNLQVACVDLNPDLRSFFSSRHVACAVEKKAGFGNVSNRRYKLSLLSVLPLHSSSAAVSTTYPKWQFRQHAH
uniref:Uncharacterized protein n=1 Tax=Nelumbo nucifera TaxID=4432 RepID=A0A822ZAK2_NELNU|nr:TPA_asm: hypothetical protein HUJ06_015893 [Nelumbo nucifera]